MNTKKTTVMRAVVVHPGLPLKTRFIAAETIGKIQPGKTMASRLSLMLCWVIFCWVALPVSAIANVTWKPEAIAQPEEPRDIPNPLFDDASYSANLYYHQRDSKRYNVETGKFEKNWRHSTIQSTFEINSGYAGDRVGVDFAAIVVKDLRNSGAPNHEYSFVP